MSESIVLFERKSGYTVLPNELLRDKRLALRTKGFLAMMISLPPDWKYRISGLSTIANVGRDSIRSMLGELEQAGYLERRQAHNEHGRFDGFVFVLRDVSTIPEVNPDTPPLTPLPSPEKPSTVDPSTVSPHADGPPPKNPTLLSKDSIQERSNKAPIVPQGGRKRREVKEQPDWYPERFSKFWDFYSHHVRGESKQAAIRAWDKLRPDDTLIDTMGKALTRQLQSEQWQQGIGIPYASTWINQRRWEDEVGPKIRPLPDAHSVGWAADPEVTE